MDSKPNGPVGPALALQPDTRVRFVTDGAEGVILATVAHGSLHPVEYDVLLNGPADVERAVTRTRVPAADVYPVPADLDEAATVLRHFKPAGPKDGRTPGPADYDDAVHVGEGLLSEVMWRRELLDELLAVWRDVPDFPNRLTVESGAPELAELLGQLDRLDEQWHTYKPGDLVRVTYTDDATGIDVSYWARVIGPAKRDGDYEVEVVHVGRGSRVEVGKRFAPIRTTLPGLYGGPIRFVPARSVPGGDS
jgi:hypothetical protein